MCRWLAFVHYKSFKVHRLQIMHAGNVYSSVLTCLTNVFLNRELLSSSTLVLVSIPRRNRLSRFSNLKTTINFVELLQILQCCPNNSHVKPVCDPCIYSYCTFV